MKISLSKERQILFDVIFLALIYWLARYFLSAGFGLYEDDFTRIPNAISMSFSKILNHLIFLMRYYYANRPFHEGLIYLFSYLGWQIGGLQGIYWLGYILTATNILIFYILLTRLYDRSFALLGGLAYALFSADTTQAYLTLSFGGQFANTLLLLALHCFLSNKRWVSYLLIFSMILFAYETPFLVFLAAPLLKKNNNWRTLFSNVVINGIVMIGMLLASVLMRYGQGSQVNFEMSSQDTFILALSHTLQGPLVALGTYFLRPYQVIRSFDPLALIISSIGFVLILIVLSNLEINFTLRPRELWMALRKKAAFAGYFEQAKMLFQLALAGLIMMFLAYPLTFTTRILAISGRTTRGHLAGVVGTSLFIACVLYLLISILTVYRFEKLAKTFIAVLFALTLGFGILIQKDYVLAWQYQKEFWRELVPVIQDAGDGTAILIQPDGLKDVLQIGANTWNLSRVLENIYIFPPGTRLVPRVFRLLPQWQSNLVNEDGLFEIDGDTVTGPSDNYGGYPSTQVILVKMVSDHFEREETPLLLSDKTYPLKNLTDPDLTKLPRGILYHLLIDEP
jgi:hypothetical protein